MKIFQKISLILLSFFLITILSLNQAIGLESLNGEQDEVQEVKKLSLQSVDVVELNVLKLNFDVRIDDTKEKDFIVKGLPAGNEIEVTQISVDENGVLISVGEEFESNNKYEVVIISLYGVDGSTIVSGIDGAVEFNAPDMKTLIEEVEVPIIEEDMQSAIEEDLNSSIEEDVELKSAEQENNSQSEEQNPNESESLNAKSSEENNQVDQGGKDVSQQEIDKNISVAAGKTTDLPTTGPEHVFFIILAIVLAGLLIYVRRKRI